MEIYTHLSSGKYHAVNGEDFLYYQLLEKKFLIGAVMDGCSSGKESYFASTLYGKSVRKACRMLPNMKEIMPGFELESMEKEAIGAFILGQLFEDIKKVKRTLFLEVEELLSTIILMVYNVEDRSCWINVSGDGLVVFNDTVKEVDQNNIPDYLAYHLNIKFDEWHKNHTLRMDFEHVKDISISTDGISKLQQNPLTQSERIDPVVYFLIQKPDGNEAEYLTSKYLKLVEGDKYIPFDDVAFIRLIP